ncbi:MAG TPA: hypothetical protein PK511_11955 [Chitinophagales bacterium]|nr:hypothetical protein [Chitinophagales bacterium]HMU68550.1 hypothetical protein [Chitinophagales bacterium]HMX05660.1 hypothetical protein [Chitinophagales bacterium]HMZ89606.1 hypothetical protein [Chitinophagales bacterium]HNA58337.1 hypothetical protein [Chitinophagales bacterium]
MRQGKAMSIYFNPLFWIPIIFSIGLIVFGVVLITDNPDNTANLGEVGGNSEAASTVAQSLMQTLQPAFTLFGILIIILGVCIGGRFLYKIGR